jgi:thioredoxin-related protein
MLSRRDFLVGPLAGALGASAAWGQAVLGDDGLYHQPWFLQSLLELGDDLQAAADNGKRFAVMWELRACPYCRDTHLINFARPEIESFIKARFDILQLNLVGAREVTDFDGQKLTEKQLAEKYGIRFSPTVQFFPERTDGLDRKRPREREIIRTQGYLQPPQFLGTFRYIAERAYERGTLLDFLKSNS